MPVQNWPLQSQCDAFYGNPRGPGGAQADPIWMRDNLVRISAPFQLTFAGHPVGSIIIHKKCFASLGRVFDALWAAAGKDQKVIDSWGVSTYAGTFNYRLMRGINRLSMHSYGCAIDLDPERNSLADGTPHFAKCPQVLKAFADEGWVWGGSWQTRPDGMHFQAARVG